MDYLTFALLMIAVGVILLLAEILLPTGGILVVAALLFFAVGVGTIVYRGTSLEAAVALGGLALGLPAAGFVAVSAWRRLSIGRELESGIADASVARVPQIAELDALRGRVGRTASPMRPSGTVEFDGRRVDAMTEGVMLDAGVWVRCVDVKVGKVVVRRMDAPPDVSDIRPDGAAPPPQDLAPDRDPDRRPDAPPRPAPDPDDFDIGLDKP